VIYHFKSQDDELFVLDTAHMRWGRASSILSTPSVAAAEQHLARYVYSEEGALVPMGAGVYNLDGRTPKTEGPGAGLSTVGIMAVPFETTLFIYLRPNVNIKSDSFKSGFPEEAQKFIKHQILQPHSEQENASAPASAQ
jgi:hypothetical protein